MSSKQESVPNISIYFPDYSYQQLLSIVGLDTFKGEILHSISHEDWENQFCDELGLSTKNLPWNQLRGLQFDIEPNTDTVVCCDPVMMQMTHRGAYLWGQQQLEFSKEDVIRIIAQINQQLMGDDECFYLVDNNQWLYTNKREIALDQASYEESIGKDMFGFSYAGQEGNYWDKLATEIQMLIKQMMDYQGLTPAPAEMIVNAYFWGDSKIKINSPFEKSEASDIRIFVSDNLIELFVKASDVGYAAVPDFVPATSTNDTANNILVIKQDDRIDVSQLVADVIDYSKTNAVCSVRFVTQDKIISLKKEYSVFKKILNIFRREKSQ